MSKRIYFITVLIFCFGLHSIAQIQADSSKLSNSANFQLVNRRINIINEAGKFIVHFDTKSGEGIAWIPLIYENSIMPPPEAEKWFHATIVAQNDSVKVYVNHSLTPSLQVKKLGNMKDGMIGLWDDGLSGDFANLRITQ